MKKYVGSIFIFALVLLLNLPTPVLANTLYEESDGSNLNNILEIFPDLKKDLEEKGYDEIVSEENVYLKVGLKDINNKKEVYEPEDFVITEVDSSEFYRAKLEDDVNLDSKATFASRSQNYFENLGGDSYLQLSLCVIRNSSKPYKFTVNHNYNWLKQPFFNFEDVIGISVSPTMKINSDSYKSQSIAVATGVDPTSPTGVGYKSEIVSNTDIKHNAAGIATKFDLIDGVRGQSGYITCEAEFSQPAIGGTQTANVFGNYIHTKVGLSGGVSLDSEGKPSIGLNLIEKEYNFAVDVDYTK